MIMEFKLVDGVQVFPGSICFSGSVATPVVNCGTARVPMEFANVRFTHTL